MALGAVLGVTLGVVLGAALAILNAAGAPPLAGALVAWLTTPRNAGGDPLALAAICPMDSPSGCCGGPSTKLGRLLKLSSGGDWVPAWRSRDVWLADSEAD